MAKPKRKNRKPQRNDFYEAIPAAFVPTAGVGDVPSTLKVAGQTLTEAWQAARQLAGPAWRLIASQIRQAGLAATRAMADWAWSGLMAARYAGSATLHYTPAMATDAAIYADRIGHRLRSPQARSLYLMTAAGAGLALVVVTGVTATTTLHNYAADISSPASILAKKKTGTTILDRNGQVLFEGYGAQDTQLVDLKDVPMTLRNATLAAEDPGFYDHQGFSLRGTARAAINDITHQNTAEGGSTLTQQLIKNALLTSDKNFQRKYQEILLSVELEHRYTKDQIFQMYLNETFYGEGSSGVAAASATYFHKPFGQLTLGESALLAGLPLGPTRFDPNFDIASATGRRDYVLSRMADIGKITQAQAKAAKAQPIVLAGTPAEATPNAMVVYPKTITIRAPHFVFYVLDQLRSQYGEDMVENGGITVRTTLDLSKQQLAESTVSAQINRLSDHHVTNGGLISIEPKTGDIVAMVGSADYNAPGFGNVNVTLSDLQPGSSFKPIAYATAFKKGWTGATTILDAPVAFPGGDGTIYAPQNYDLRFHGTITLRHALDNSLNVPAVKVLQFAGLPDTLQTAHDLGITTLNEPSRYGLSLVLGGGEVRPIDMATVYGTFANGGVRVEPRSILQVTSRSGADVTKPAAAPKAVLDPRIAYMITNILSDDSARQPEFPANGPLTLGGRPVAAKTGTTNDFRDNWTVGYTPQLVTAVWVGNNDHTPMYNVDGITGAAPIWHDYMEAALADQPSISFTVPPGITMAKVCAADGGLANPWDTGYNEFFMSDSMPGKKCASYAPKPSPSPSNTPGPENIPLPTTQPIVIPNLPPGQLRHLPPSPIPNPFSN